MKERYVVIAIAAALLCFAPAFSPAGAVDLPATGQTLCYDTAGTVISCAGTGQDGELKMGVAWPTPRFVVGAGAEVDCVTDTLTGLMWVKSPNGVTPRVWVDAVSDANSLTLCGYSDWRLPNVNEIESLVNAGGANMSTWLNSQGFSSNPVSYWASTSGAFYTMNAWRAGMLGGPLNDDRLKSDTRQYVWPVRGTTGPSSLWRTGQAVCYDGAGAVIDCSGTGQDGELQQGVPWPEPRFTVVGDCVRDNLTHLAWPKNPDLGAKAWSDALNDANTLTLCGHSEWRLPNREELRSLVHYGQANNANWLVAQGFGNNVHLLEPFWYWTSSTYVNTPGYAWVITMFNGRVLQNLKSDSSNIRVWPVSDAAFLPVTRYTLTAHATGNGSGTVSSNVGGISFTYPAVAMAASTPIDEETSVTVTATALPGSVFTGWTGDCSGTGDCTVTMDGAKEVTAQFSLIQHTLTAHATGNGSGRIVSSVGGIDYTYPGSSTGTSAPINEGASVTVTATSFPGSVLMGWTGDCSGRGVCTVTMDRAKDVTAQFSLIQSFPFNDDFSTDKSWFGYVPGEWERGEAEAGGGENGHPDPAQDHTQTGDDFLLGFAIGGDYPNGLPARTIMAPPVDCTGKEAVFLKFYRFLNVEGNGADEAKIEVSLDGDTWTEIWKNPPIDLTDDRWVPVVIDLSAAAKNQKTVFTRFTMGPTNGSKRYSGWNIDDYEITADVVYPSEGTIGARLVILGDQFGATKGKLLMGNAKPKVITWSDEKIECSLSKVPPAGAVYDMVIQPKLPKKAPAITLPEVFVVRSPEVFEVEPLHGGIGAEVTLKGRFFGTKKGKIYFENMATGARKNGKVIAWPIDPAVGAGVAEVRFAVPKIAAGTYRLIVVNKVGQGTFESFTVAP